MRILKPLFGIIILVVLLGCEDVLEVTDISEESVELLAPSDSVTVEQSEVTFNWNQVYEAEEYHVQIAQPNFENASQILLDSIIVVDSSSFSSRITKSLIDSNYEWRVKAMNSGYETEYSQSNFIVDTSGN